MRMRTLLGCLVLSCMSAAGPSAAADMSRTVSMVKKSVVGVGSFQKTRTLAMRFTGTGFVVGDGLSVITNAHVLPATLDTSAMEMLGVVVGQGDDSTFRTATVVETDREHDLALLRISGAPLPALQLGDGQPLSEGRELAFTGYPLGMVLGLYPVTHRALLSAITPIVSPSLSSGKLSAAAITQMQRARFPVYQLDATAYPGNSGSPLYDPDSGVVHGVLNMVFVKGLKESAITSPSGITYAIPVAHVRAMLQRQKNK